MAHQSNAVWRLEWLTMATGSTGPTDTTGPRLWPTPSWKEEELSGLGEGTSNKEKAARLGRFLPLRVFNLSLTFNSCR